MTREQDYKRFVELMEWAGVMTAIPNGKQIGPLALAMFDELAQYPFKAVALAVRSHCRSERFFPTLADIVQRIEGTAEDRAALAWAEVLRAMRRFGYYDSVRFPDPAIHYAISQMGGWKYLCATLRDDTLPFRQKDFAQHYDMGRRLGAQARPAAYLMGAHEMDCRARGFDMARKVYDTATGNVIPESELPALTAGTGKTAEIVQMVTRKVEVSA